MFSAYSWGIYILSGRQKPLDLRIAFRNKFDNEPATYFVQKRCYPTEGQVVGYCQMVDQCQNKGHFNRSTF